MYIQRRDDTPHNEYSRTPLSLRDAMNKLFDESFWSPLDGQGMLPDVPRDLFPKVDISETDTEVKVVANVPGIDPEQVNVEVDEDSLTLSGIIEEERENEDARHYRFEREFGEFRRDFLLPARVDPEKVSADSKNGVITVTLPKVSDESNKKRIEVKGR